MHPLYAATIDNIDDGIYAISLVTDPATETDWQCFAKQYKQDLSFAIDNEEEHIIASVVMLADVPIYRRNADGYEYNIIYHKDTIKLMAEKMLSDCTHNNIDIQHNGELLDKGVVQLVELFIKDETAGINPSYLDVPDGSLIAKYKIHNEELWEMCKNGTLNGISLAGFFNVEEEKFKKIYKKKNMLKKIKTALMSLILQYSEVKTDNGILYYEGDELVEGLHVTDENEDPVEDGDYTLEDGTIVTIKDSKVETITVKDDESDNTDTVDTNDNTPDEGEKLEDEPIDEPTEEPTDEDVKEDDEIASLKADIEILKSEIEQLKETIKTISETPAAEPVVEEFKTIVETNTNTNRAALVASYLNK